MNFQKLWEDLKIRKQESFDTLKNLEGDKREEFFFFMEKLPFDELEENGDLGEEIKEVLMEE